MLYPVLISLGVGFFVVLQAGANREIAQKFGLPGATVLNSLFVLIVALIVYFVTKEIKILEHSKLSIEIGKIKWWYPITGFLGCFIVLGIPYGISQIGAAKTILFAICAQVVAGILWDMYVESIPLSGVRVVGGLLTIFGVLLVSSR